MAVVPDSYLWSAARREDASRLDGWKDRCHRCSDHFRFGSGQRRLGTSPLRTPGAHSGAGVPQRPGLTDLCPILLQRLECRRVSGGRDSKSAPQYPACFAGRHRDSDDPLYWVEHAVPVRLANLGDERSAANRRESLGGTFRPGGHSLGRRRDGTFHPGLRQRHGSGRTSGLFPKKLAGVHAQYQSPASSILFQSAWTSVLILTGTFEQLIVYSCFVLVLFSALAVASVIVLRWRRPELHLPFRVPL